MRFRVAAIAIVAAYVTETLCLLAAGRRNPLAPAARWHRSLAGERRY
jgi:hypothetical protein